jgi:hypothetical protein
LESVLGFVDKLYHQKRALVAPLVVFVILAASAYAGYRLNRLPVFYLFAACGALALIAVTLKDVRLGLTLLVFASGTVGLSIGTGTQSSINVGMILVALLTGVWLARMLVTRHFRLVPTPLNRPLLAFLVAAAVSFIYGPAVAGASGGLRIAGLTVQAGQYGIWALTAAVFLLSANHPVGERALWLWIGFLIAVGVAIMVAGIALQSRDVLSVWGGSLYMWPVVLLLAQILFNHDLDGRIKLLGFGGLGIWGYWAVKVALISKSLFVPAVLAFLVLFFLRSRRLAILILAVVVTVVLVVGPGRISQMLTEGEEYSASPIRPNLWWDVFRLGARSPLLGLGPANYTYYWSDQTFQSLSYEYVSPYAFTRQAYAPPAHNMFADLFAQTGAIGLILFTWALVGSLRLGWQTLKRPLSPFARAYVFGVLVGFASLIVSSFFFCELLLPYVYNLGFRYFPQAAYAWLLLGTLTWVGTSGAEGPTSKV